MDESELDRLANTEPKMRDEPQAFKRACIRMGYEAARVEHLRNFNRIFGAADFETMDPTPPKPPAPAPSMDCICGGTAVRREQEGWHWIECTSCRRRTSGTWSATGAAGALDRVHTPKPSAGASAGVNRGEAQAQPVDMAQAQREGGDV